MPPRIAPQRCAGLRTGLFLAGLASCATPIAGQELLLQRDYPGSGPYICPAPAQPATPLPEDVARAGQLASNANQAMILADYEGVQALLAQAVQLDPLSPDWAYRHASVLEILGDIEAALPEYCRALDLDVETIGVFGVREKIDELYGVIRERLPVEARDAFISGLANADSAMYVEAIDDFTVAIETAPDWGAPVYNRAVIYEVVGDIQSSLVDYQAYIDLAPSDVDPILVIVSERIGALEGAASVALPSPNQALALGMIPGMGHYYTGRAGMGTATLIAAGSAIVAGLMFKNITTVCVDVVPAGGACPTDLIVDEITERPYLWYGVSAAAVVTIAGAIDAMLKARQRRAEAEAITGQRNGTGLQIGRPSVTPRGTGVDLNLFTLRFR